MWIFYLAALISVFLQSISRNFFWPIIVVGIAAEMVPNPAVVYTLAAASGILSDVVIGRTVGESALFLLAAALFLLYLNRRFKRSLKIAITAIIVMEVIYRALVVNLGF